MTSDLIQVKQRYGVKTITLNRPKKLNALSIELITVLEEELVKTEHGQAQLLVLRGNGKAFCAGGDVSALSLKAKKATKESIDEGNYFMQRQYQLNHICASLSIPAIAVWHKIAMGGGIGISVPLDFRIATEATMIAMPECGIAFFPDVGASWFLNQLKPGIGLYLALTGTRVMGYDAIQYGLATHYMDAAQVEHAIKDLEEVSSATTLSLKQIDEILSAHAIRGTATVTTREMHDIEHTFTKGSLSEILASLTSMNTEWSNKTLQAIRAGSPTAVTVTFELLQRSARLSMEECRALEYIVHTNFMRLPDFVEGVHKKLIAKPPGIPKWKPERIEDCSPDYIQSFFIQRDDTLALRNTKADPHRQNRFLHEAVRSLK